MTDYNAADRKDIRRAEKLQKVADQQHGEVVVSIASTEAGRKYLWEKLEAAHLFQMVYPTDPHQAYFILGQRNEGQLLFEDIIRYCPDQFLQMMREHNGRRTSTSPSQSDTGERSNGEDAGGDYSGSAGASVDGYSYRDEAGFHEH